jgi:ATP-dependent helicase/nuclease subunit B
LYYGFYDLTQIQLDFFHAVARDFPTTLFFPLLAAQPSHGAWQFTERFYERYLQGHSSEPAAKPPNTKPLPAMARLFDDDPGRAYAEMPKDWQCRVFSSFGMHDEVAGAAKEILRLSEDEKLPFHEIGVIARSLEAYGGIVKDIFHQHRIPIAGTFESPLVAQPLAKAVILLLSLPGKDFLRNQVIDFLSSPYVQFNNLTERKTTPRPELWDLASRELAICKGVSEWRRLRRFGKRGLILSQRSDDDEPRAIRIPAAQLTFLANIVDTLAGDLSHLPAEASWHEFANAWKILLQRYLGIVADADTTAANASPQATIVKILDQLAALDTIKDRVSQDDFSHTFAHWLERTSVTEDRRNRDGVMVLSATAARGLSFRALFALGINEGVFPRTIREDAFLRDSDREVLERDLGYKVNQKLTAFDEEKLLFTLLAGAARRRLYCSFQRADDNGRVLSPSWYLGELQRALRAADREVEVVNIPRSLAEKGDAAPFDRQTLLLPSELAVRLTLQSEDPTALVEATAALPELFKHGRNTIAELDQSSARLLGFDGVLPDFDPFWKSFSERGPAPTALETYARCPFQFFARQVLHLQPLDWPEEALGPSPAEFGQLGHEILDRFYGDLIERGYFAGKAEKIDIDETLQAVTHRAFATYEDTNPVGYPLFWESLKENLQQTLRQAIARDLAELAQSGFVPVSLETKVSARLPENWPAPLKNLPIRGRMDRIDRDDHNGRLRVIDYKFKFGTGPKRADKDLMLAALRGERLQPPLYVLLAQQWAREKGIASTDLDIEADFYYIASRWPEGPLDSRSYASTALTGKIGAATQETIAYLAEGVRRGHFFINRGEYCGYCDIAPICRKNHPPSLWRAENDPITEIHRDLQDKDPKKL